MDLHQRLFAPTPPTGGNRDLATTSGGKTKRVQLPQTNHEASECDLQRTA